MIRLQPLVQHTFPSLIMDGTHSIFLCYSRQEDLELARTTKAKYVFLVNDGRLFGPLSFGPFRIVDGE